MIIASTDIASPIIVGLRDRVRYLDVPEEFLYEGEPKQNVKNNNNFRISCQRKDSFIGYFMNQEEWHFLKMEIKRSLWQLQTVHIVFGMKCPYELS